MTQPTTTPPPVTPTRPPTLTIYVARCPKCGVAHAAICDPRYFARTTATRNRAQNHLQATLYDWLARGDVIETHENQSPGLTACRCRGRLDDARILEKIGILMEEDGDDTVVATSLRQDSLPQAASAQEGGAV